MLCHLLHAVEGLVDLLGTLPLEGNRDDTHGEDAHLLADAGNDGGGACTGAAAHTCRYEYHLRTVVQHGLDILSTVLGSLAGFLRTVAGTKTFGAQLEVAGHG